MVYHNANYDFSLMNILKCLCLTFLDFNSSEYAKPGDSQFEVSMIIFCLNLDHCFVEQPLRQFHSIIIVSILSIFMKTSNIIVDLDLQSKNNIFHFYYFSFCLHNQNNVFHFYLI